MKKTLLATLTLVIFNLNVFSQLRNLNKDIILSGSNTVKSDTVNISSEFLLLGTLNDYIGRKWVNSEGQFDRYNSYEKPLMEFVDSVVKNVFKIALIKKGDHFVSEEMSKKMNAFYNGNHLIDSLLYADTEHKLSFLTGVYLRNGEKINGHLYKIRLINSPKHINCYEILKQLHCEKIYYNHLNNIPASDILYFEATPLIEKYFASVAVYQKKIQESMLNHLFKNSTDPKTTYLKFFGPEYDKVQSLFKEQF